ncbi:MAG: hypothetical protein ACK53K_03895 [Burkholderiales bacterium]
MNAIDFSMGRNFPACDLLASSDHSGGSLVASPLRSDHEPRVLTRLLQLGDGVDPDPIGSGLQDVQGRHARTHGGVERPTVGELTPYGSGCFGLGEQLLARTQDCRLRLHQRRPNRPGPLRLPRGKLLLLELPANFFTHGRFQRCPLFLGTGDLLSEGSPEGPVDFQPRPDSFEMGGSQRERRLCTDSDACLTLAGLELGSLRHRIGVEVNPERADVPGHRLAGGLVVGVAVDAGRGATRPRPRRDVDVCFHGM